MEILFNMKDKQRLVTSEERRKDAPDGLSIWDGDKGNCKLNFAFSFEIRSVLFKLQ